MTGVKTATTSAATTARPAYHAASLTIVRLASFGQRPACDLCFGIEIRASRGAVRRLASHHETHNVSASAAALIGFNVLLSQARVYISCDIWLGALKWWRRRLGA